MRLNYLLILLFLPSFLLAQDGLEGIIVEKYYVSNSQDKKGELFSGELPEGSVTYRIFVDLKPGFRFQAAFGSPEHPLRIESTANFYNHIEAGRTHPNILPERALRKDLALLDSWLSVGAAGENHYGVPRAFDNGKPDEYLKFEEGYFKGNKKVKGIAVGIDDGLERSTELPFPTFYQMDSCLKFLGSSTNGNGIYIDNGAWACMGKGAVGADSLTTNTVLIAQLTTAGDLSFDLNLLIGAPNGTSQKYVYSNPAYDEWVHKDLKYSGSSTKPVKRNKKSRKKNK